MDHSNYSKHFIVATWHAMWDFSTIGILIIKHIITSWSFYNKLISLLFDNNKNSSSVLLLSYVASLIGLFWLIQLRYCAKCAKSWNLSILSVNTTLRWTRKRKNTQHTKNLPVSHHYKNLYFLNESQPDFSHYKTIIFFCNKTSILNPRTSQQHYFAYEMLQRQ